MKLLKPAWVTHDGKPIFSVDVHPQGGRFATGGQGADSGRIVVWNIEPLLSEDAELDPKIPKMLCQMDNHLACVNIVRWSCNGNLLASGGDDKLIMIWKLTGEGSSVVFGGNGKVNIETWRCVATLSSHTGDVLDLAWASHDGWLASCSVDNNVIVWNARKFPEKVAVLKGHTGLVKGVTWDPVGKYLASQSDDKSVRVWRTADWAQEEMIIEPFEECSGTTHVLRLSWSPDGQYLVSAHAMNGGGPTAQIIEREGWKRDIDFVGHRKAVTCVRFNSNILQRFNPGSPKKQQYCCCAIGARDRSLSVWLTSLKRPLVVVQELFTSSILDLSWSSSGLQLFACSWDGTVAYIEFTPVEMGKPLSAKEKNVLYERMYGKKNWFQNTTATTQIVENPEMLANYEELPSKNLDSIKPSTAIIPEQVRSVLVPSKITVAEKPTTNNTVVQHLPTNKQIEVRLPDGKRRITPMFLPTNSPSDSNKTLPKPEALSSSSPSKSKIIVEKVRDLSEVTNIFHPSPVSLRKVPERPAVCESLVNKITGIQIGAVSRKDLPGEEPSVHCIAPLNALKFSTNNTITKMCNKTKIQIKNEQHLIPNGSLCRIHVFEKATDEQPVWETFLCSTVRFIAANRKILVVCSEDLTLNYFNLTTGTQDWPPTLLDDAVVSLSLSDKSICLLLTASGLLYMWDLNSNQCILNRVSIRNLLTSTITITGCCISPSEYPIVTLSDGRAYMYQIKLHMWLLLANPLDPLYQVGASLIASSPESLPLSSLQKANPTSYSLHHQSSMAIADTLPSGVLLSFLEKQLAACLALESPIEYKYWLLATVTHLLEKGPECRLRSVLDNLLISKKTDRTILGITKMSLLNDALVLIRNKLQWQRLYKEYKEQVELLEGDQ